MGDNLHICLPIGKFSPDLEIVSHLVICPQLIGVPGCGVMYGMGGGGQIGPDHVVLWEVTCSYSVSGVQGVGCFDSLWGHHTLVYRYFRFL